MGDARARSGAPETRPASSARTVRAGCRAREVNEKMWSHPRDLNGFEFGGTQWL